MRRCIGKIQMRRVFIFVLCIRKNQAGKRYIPSKELFSSFFRRIQKNNMPWKKKCVEFLENECISLFEWLLFFHMVVLREEEFTTWIRVSIENKRLKDSDDLSQVRLQRSRKNPMKMRIFVEWLKLGRKKTTCMNLSIWWEMPASNVDRAWNLLSSQVMDEDKPEKFSEEFVLCEF